MRLIDADVAKENVVKAILGDSEFAQDIRNTCYETIDDAPTIDAVPVVRCCGCIKRHTPDCAMWYRCSVCDGQWSWETNDGFCSYGERKTQRNDDGGSERNKTD